MSLSTKLLLRHSQSLVMTPQLLQSIRLLQLGHEELERLIDEEIERNPLIERAETTDRVELADTSADGDGEPGSKNDGEIEPEWSAQSMAERLDASLENVFPDDPGVADRLEPLLAEQWKSAGGGAAPTGEGFDIDDMAAAETTLRDHIGQQIALTFVDPVERAIARTLADGLDEMGYLRIDPGEAAERLDAGPATVAHVLAVCQGFDPPGLFARDLADCLALQLKSRDRLDPAMRAMLEHLDLLAKRDFQALKRLCGVQQDDLIDMLREIKTLDPKPGLAFSGGIADTIVPDVIVRAAPDGTWQIELNPDTLPRVLVDHSYYARVAGHASNAPDRAFLAECLQNANWLTRSLDQRARTILKVATEIVRQQDAFMLHGVRHLRPLNLKTIAEAIGMHESTVSRVTSNKYMLTPRGAFELRYFFTAAISATEDGAAHSSEAVRDRIRQLIAEEGEADILSDDIIVDLLRRGGVDIARRTVAKYREGMNIASSVQRRREKRAMAAVGQ